MVLIVLSITVKFTIVIEAVQGIIVAVVHYVIIVGASVEIVAVVIIGELLS